MALTAALDKSSYNAGDTMTLTVVSDKRLSSDTIDAQAGGEDVKVTTTIQTGVAITDSSGRTWTLKSDDGKTAVYTSKA
jgi:hypothetical protein